MDESRKRVIGIMASILAARKLANYDAGRRVPATMCAIADAMQWAEEIISPADQVKLVSLIPLFVAGVNAKATGEWGKPVAPLGDVTGRSAPALD